MVDILHVPFVFFPDPSGGTEVYVDGLIRALRQQGFKGAVAAPANEDAEYDHNGIRVFRFAKTAAADLSYAYGTPDERAAQSFRAVLGRVRPRIVHMHAHTSAVSELLVDAAHDSGAKVVFTYHTPTVSCARGTMLLMGRSPCDGKIDVGRCSVCVLASHGVPAGLRDLVVALPRGLGERLHAAGLSGSAVTALRIPALLESGYRRFRSISGKIDCMVAVCEWVRSVLLTNDVPEAKIKLCRQGLPHSGSMAMPEPAVSGTEAGTPLIVGYFGRLDETKGVHVLVEAMRRAPDANVRLRIYGVRQAGSESYVKQLETAVSLDRRINMEPPVDSRLVTRAMRGCDLVAIPSQWLETGPLVVYEAYAAGVPVIGSRLGGIAELVTDGVDGRLVETGDADAWSAEIRMLADERATVERLRKGIRPPRTMESVAGEMAAIYRSVLAEYAV